MLSEHWSMFGRHFVVDTGLCLDVGLFHGYWSVLSDYKSVFAGHWSVFSGHWLVFSGQ